MSITKNWYSLKIHNPYCHNVNPKKFKAWAFTFDKIDLSNCTDFLLLYYLQLALTKVTPFSMPWQM